MIRPRVFDYTKKSLIAFTLTVKMEKANIYLRLYNGHTIIKQQDLNSHHLPI
jgi:hypothetical protein